MCNENNYSIVLKFKVNYKNKMEKETNKQQDADKEVLYCSSCEGCRIEMLWLNKLDNTFQMRCLNCGEMILIDNKFEFFKLTEKINNEKPKREYVG